MKNIVAIAILIILSIIIHWKWMLVSSLFGAGDFSYFLKFPQSWIEYASVPKAWDPIWGNGFGTFNVIMFMYPVYFAIALMSKYGIDLIWILKLTNFIPLVVFLPIFSYILAKKTSNSIAGGIIGSVIYSYNAYILLLQKGGILLTVIAYALIPLVIYLVSKGFEEKSYVKGIFAGLVGFFISFNDFRFFYLTCVVLIIHFFWHLIIYGLKDFQIKLIIFLIPIILTLILNTYWILPIMLYGRTSDNIAISSGLFGGDMSLKQSLVFFHPYWDSGRNSTPGTVNPTPEILFLLPVLAILAIIKRKNYSESSFYLIVLGLGIFLTKQSAPPFSDVYLWLFKHFPGFNAFRESSKFYLFTALGYSQLVAVAVAVMEKSKRHYLKYLLPIALCLFFIWDTRSFLTGQAKGMFLEKTIPSVYTEFEKQIASDKNFGRILWVPSYSQWSVNEVNHPRVSAYLVYMENLQKMLTLYPGYKPVINPSSTAVNNYIILNLFNQDFSVDYLKYLGIKKIVIPPSGSIPEDDLFNKIYGLYSDRGALIRFFDNLPYLIKDPSYSGVDVYSLDYDVSRFYVSKSSLDLSNLQTISLLDYKKLNSQQYKIKIVNNDRPIYIHFTETSDKGWVLTEAEMNGQSFPRDQKSETLGFNVFRVDPSPNLSPGEDRDLTLYYAPQQYVYYGSVVSIATLLTILAIAIIHIKDKYAH